MSATATRLAPAGTATRLQRLQRLIRAEFAEMPCMRLTDNQFRRLWNLTPAEAQVIMRQLVEIGYLVRFSDGQLGRAGASY